MTFGMLHLKTWLQALLLSTVALRVAKSYTGRARKRVFDMKIILTEHARVKLQVLKRHGFEVTQNMIREAVQSPDRVTSGYRGRKVAQKSIKDSHVLRVVYEVHPEELRIITCYPARKERYEQD